MVTGRVDGGETVDTSWETLGDVGSQNTVGRSSVETLEESEDLGVQGRRRLEIGHQLHCNVTVALDDTVDQLLRSGIVSVGRVRERSGNQIADLEGNGERAVGSDGVKILGEVEFGGRLAATYKIDSRRGRKRSYHAIFVRDITHGGGVTGTLLDLETIGNGLADTEADEVVPGGSSIASSHSVVTVKLTC